MVAFCFLNPVWWLKRHTMLGWLNAVLRKRFKEAHNYINIFNNEQLKSFSVLLMAGSLRNVGRAFTSLSPKIKPITSGVPSVPASSEFYQQSFIKERHWKVVLQRKSASNHCFIPYIVKLLAQKYFKVLIDKLVSAVDAPFLHLLGRFHHHKVLFSAIIEYLCS